MSEPWFTVDIANDPTRGAGRYCSEAEAIAKAAEMASAYGFNTPIAVWDDRDDPVYLFFLGEQFKRV